jgi:RNA polymerase sigma-70 factor, ECF subfamily
MTPVPQPSSSDALSDADIVARVVAGETALFELILRRYNQRIYRTVRGIVRDESEAEDVMQQAYVNAFANLRQFAGRSSLSTWLTRIAINEALARVRPRALRIADDFGEEALAQIMEQIEETSPDPEQQAATSQLSRFVEAEIAALPERYRCVILLREVEGLSTAETAECLGLAEDAVKTRLHRARAALRDNLYRRAGLTFDSLFTFGQSRCDVLVATVMARIGTPIRLE